MREELYWGETRGAVWDLNRLDREEERKDNQVGSRERICTKFKSQLSGYHIRARCGAQAVTSAGWSRSKLSL